MSYTIDIPENVKKDVVKVLKRNKMRMHYDIKDMTFLIEVYHRYVAELERGKTVEQMVDAALRCGTCINFVRKMYETQKMRQSWGITEEI